MYTVLLTDTLYLSLHIPVVFYCRTKSNDSISLSLSLFLPPLSPTQKTLVYSTHEAANLLNIYFSSLSRSLWLLLCVIVCVCACPAVCFFFQHREVAVKLRPNND